MADWYDAEKTKPAPFVSVLVRMPGERPCPTVREGYYNGHEWVAAGFIRGAKEVTHWTDMPVYPGDDDEEWLYG